MKRIIALIMALAMTFTISVSAYAADKDYKNKTVEELDIVINDNNTMIEKRSKKLKRTNNSCIELIKQMQNIDNKEVIDRINDYAESMKESTDTIKKQKKSCASRSKKVEKAKNGNKSKKTIKKRQIRYINSQKKLLRSLKKANNKSKKFVKYVKKNSQVKEEETASN